MLCLGSRWLTICLDLQPNLWKHIWSVWLPRVSHVCAPRVCCGAPPQGHLRRSGTPKLFHLWYDRFLRYMQMFVSSMSGFSKKLPLILGAWEVQGCLSDLFNFTLFPHLGYFTCGKISKARKWTEQFYKYNKPPWTSHEPRIRNTSGETPAELIRKWINNRESDQESTALRKKNNKHFQHSQRWTNLGVQLRRRCPCWGALKYVLKVGLTILKIFSNTWTRDHIFFGILLYMFYVSVPGAIL